jgi:biopolymer transport protein ExbB/TolQ
MMGFFREMGFYAWPLGLIAVAVVALAVRAALRLREAAPRDRAPLEHAVNAVLFWGCVAGVVGILGQFHGIYQAAKAISRAGAISPQMIWGGIAVSFTSTLAGLAILLVAALAWAALRGALHRRERAVPAT